MELIEGPELVDETIEGEGTSSLLTSLRAPKTSELARKRKLLHRIVSHATIITNATILKCILFTA